MNWDDWRGGDYDRGGKRLGCFILGELGGTRRLGLMHTRDRIGSVGLEWVESCYT